MTTTIPEAQPSLPELGLSEAQQLAEKIRVATGGLTRQLGRLRELAVEFYERGGHRTLGYATIEECCRKEFGWHRVTFWRALQDATIERQLGAEVGTIPGSHARELRRLPADQRKDAYDEAKQDGKTTAADVREAVERRRTPAPIFDTAVPDYVLDGADDSEYVEGNDAEDEAQVEALPGLGAETPQDAPEMASPSRTAAPTPKPHRIEAPQATRETVGGDGLGEIDLAEIRRNGDSVGVVMAFYRLAVAAATDEAGGQARRRIVGTLLRQARGQK